MDKTELQLGHVHDLKKGGASGVPITHNLCHKLMIRDRFHVMSRRTKLFEAANKDEAVKEVSEHVIVTRSERAVPMKLAINRTVAPQLGLDAFLALARTAGVDAVEVRNDVEGQEFANGVPARELRQRVHDAGLAFASINALQRFNDWTPEREREAVALIRYARELGAPGIVMCPVIDANHGWSDGELERKLRQSLRALAPIYRDHGVVGYVEPLGMAGSTLRHQAPAVSAIGDVDALGAFEICYDTFQFFRSQDQRLFPHQIGLVHVSGIARTDLPREQLTEPDRGLIDDTDIIGNLSQLQALRTAGYDGFVSIEPFDPKVQRDDALAEKLANCVRYIDHGRSGLGI